MRHGSFERFMGAGYDAAVLELAPTRFFRGFLTHDPAPDLRGLEVPLLALFGSEDLAVPPEPNAEILRRLMAGRDDQVRIVVVPGVDHTLRFHGETHEEADDRLDRLYSLRRVRATVSPDFELVEEDVIMSMDDFVAYIQPFEAQDARMRWELQDLRQAA